MKPIKFFVLLLLAGSLIACSLSVNVPQIRTGVTETKTINETAGASSEPITITIEMGAGSLNIAAGAISTLEGTVDYNVANWEPIITNSGNAIKVTQPNTTSVGIPNGQIVNTWDLQFGSDPIELNISTGANEGAFDLSELAITHLRISDGASKTKITFNSLNPVQMEKLEYHTGASEVSLYGLGNARVNDIEFSGGAGSYLLDFSGENLNDINARISTGMCDLTLVIPADSHAIITINGGLSNINATGTWTINGSTYEVGTSGPTINVILDMAVGNLNLRQK